MEWYQHSDTKPVQTDRIYTLENGSSISPQQQEHMGCKTGLIYCWHNTEVYDLVKEVRCWHIYQG